MFEKTYEIVTDYRTIDLPVTQRCCRTIVLEIMFDTSVLTLHGSIVMVLDHLYGFEHDKIASICFKDGVQHVTFKHAADAKRMWWENPSAYSLSHVCFDPIVPNDKIEVYVCDGTKFMGQNKIE